MSAITNNGSGCSFSLLTVCNKGRRAKVRIEPRHPPLAKLLKPLKPRHVRARGLQPEENLPEYRKPIILLDAMVAVGYSRSVNHELKLTASSGQDGKAATSRSIPRGEHEAGKGRTQAGDYFARTLRRPSCPRH
jgi:hypothetical protein